MQTRIGSVEHSRLEYDSARKDLGAARDAQLKHARKTDGKVDANLQAQEAQAETILASAPFPLSPFLAVRLSPFPLPLSPFPACKRLPHPSSLAGQQTAGQPAGAAVARPRYKAQPPCAAARHSCLA